MPLSLFIVTRYLTQNLGFVDAVTDHRLDAHAHSHNHDMQTYASRSGPEIEASQRAFEDFFDRPAAGYRAPQGVIYQGDPGILAANGFAFSASIFPARRRGVFDYRAMPQVPWTWTSGVVELPFASTIGSRTMLTASYVKLLGKIYWSGILKSAATLPSVLVIDSHLHDFFRPASFPQLPVTFRMAYRRNSTKGLDLMTWLFDKLRQHGYRFVSISELHRMVAAQ
ncbi:MAG: hypothetical protein O3C57_07735 [Verrucomicrobia bacterium]|nr:hypothetical protein [Verrucomicrobiota bacterium]